MGKMKYEELLNFLQHLGKDPAMLVFEDELTGIYNRRFLLNYFQYKISWDALKGHPLSLIMMDVDYFKKINDTYGHHIGDQTLVWVAGLLKDVAGDEGIAIRYAGDEFMILIPHKGKQAALQVGKHFLQRVHEAPLNFDEVAGGLRITLSIGVASAPEDAQSGKNLIQKADTALYDAKKKGRDRLANAGEIVPQDVFAKTALHQLEEEKISGRRLQLSQVAKSFKNFNQGQNQFLIVEGAPGMGKSMFLETFRRSLVPNKMIRQLKVNGRPQEEFRPYYLVTNILISLLNQRQDKGVEIFEALGIKEMAYLAHILPQLKGKEEAPLEEDERTQREGIFNTLLYFIPKVLDLHPLILLIDDLQYADEATLLLLRRLIMHRGVSLFICGTSTSIDQLRLEVQVVPLGKFYEAHHQELNIQKINLTPLTAIDIADHLKEIFPQVRLPENFEKDLARVTQGNPLFLSEILRKMALDQKIYLSGQQWVIMPLEEGYLPSSLEEMVKNKIATLDEESRQLLYQAATFGEDVPLSLLTGSSEKKEAKVLESVDQAIAQGLLRSDFQFNDEAIHFLGKRILETIYETIEPNQKQELHERIGNYQEILYQQHLLPSPVTLVYHFQRSANQEKAKNYEKSQELNYQKLFNPFEAVQYSGERRKRRGELPAPGIPLDPAGLAQIPTVIRCLHTAVRHYRLYPSGSEPIVSTNRQLKEAIDSILTTNENLAIFHINQALMINGQKVDASEFKWVAEDLLKFLIRVELKGIVFHRGLTDRELEVLMEALGRIKLKMIDKNYWQNFSTVERLNHIELKQVQYTLMVEPEVQVKGKGTSPGTAMAIPAKVSYQMLTGEQKLDQDDLNRIPEIIRCLLSASKNIKLYPLGSKAISGTIDQLMGALRSVLTRRSVLTLAQVSHSLLVNGERVDTSEIKTLAESFMKFLNSIMLSSITFMDRLSANELRTFIGALSQLPPTGLDSKFWTRFAKEQEFSTILFDQILYESRVTPTLAGYDQDQVIEEPSEEYWIVQISAPVAEELVDAFFKEMPSRVNDLLIKGDEKQILQMVRRLFHGFQNRPSPTREKIIESCRRLLESLTLAFQHHFAKILSDPLLVAFSEEKDPNILRQIAFLLYHIATNLIQFAEYPLSSRILLNLHGRHQKLLATKDPHAQRLATILDRKLDPTTQKLLVGDLKSSESSRQQNAAQLLGSLGQVTIPLLIDTIKKEEDFRVRQIAASLLGEMGPEVAELLKRELILEGTTEERIRILEVIDTVTRDLKTELAFAMSEETPEVRQTAFQLAERLNNSQAVELLLDYAKSQNADLAAEAIECLGKLKPLAAVEVLVSLLKTTHDTKRLIACCQALGQIADPACIEPLTKILKRKGSFFHRKRRSSQVRATAAFALSQISHPRVVEVLTEFVDDRDPRVKEIAQNRVNATQSPSTQEK